MGPRRLAVRIQPGRGISIDNRRSIGVKIDDYATTVRGLPTRGFPFDVAPPSWMGLEIETFNRYRFPQARRLDPLSLQPSSPFPQGAPQFSTHEVLAMSSGSVTAPRFSSLCLCFSLFLVVLFGLLLPAAAWAQTSAPKVGCAKDRRQPVREGRCRDGRRSGAQAGRAG
jgi:hypothetical protein